MALKIDKSMAVSDFWENWQHIVAMVESEYDAVKDCEDGFYDLRLELIWDCEDEEEYPGDYKEKEELPTWSKL